MNSSSSAATEAEQRWLYSAEELRAAPSISKDGMDPDAFELEKRRGTELITKVGARLYKRLEVVSIALILLQRFYARRPLSEQGVLTTAAACLLLATKIDEVCRPPLLPFADLVTEVLRWREPARHPPDAPVDRGSDAFLAEEERIIVGERALLHACEYDLEVPLPWPFLQPACRTLGLPEAVEKSAIKFANEMLRSPLPLQYSAAALGHAAVWTALGSAGIASDRLPGLFDVLSTPVGVMEAIKARVKESFMLSTRAGGGAAAAGSTAASGSASAGLRSGAGVPDEAWTSSGGSGGTSSSAGAGGQTAGHSGHAGLAMDAGSGV